MIDAGKLLDGDVRVTDDETIAVDGLGSGEVVRVGVDEVTGGELTDDSGEGEGGVGLDGSTVGREGELGGGHLGLGGDNTHRGRVAGAGDDLLAVGELETSGETEVDAGRMT